MWNEKQDDCILFERFNETTRETNRYDEFRSKRKHHGTEV